MTESSLFTKRMRAPIELVFENKPEIALKVVQRTEDTLLVSVVLKNYYGVTLQLHQWLIICLRNESLGVRIPHVVISVPSIFICGYGV